MKQQTARKQAVLSQEKLKELLHYDPSTGIFTRLKSYGSYQNGLLRKNRFDFTGCLNKAGHVVIRLLGYKYFAHRLAWLYMTGAWPKEQIDHIDGKRDNNIFSNLREATRHQNQQNKPARGATQDKYGKWSAQIGANGRHYHLGYFATESEAHAAYLEGCRKYHGEEFMNRKLAVS